MPFLGICFSSIIVVLTTIILSSNTFGFDVQTKTSSIERGAYLVKASGCVGCHTDKLNKGQYLSGGREILSPYGQFYSPNITPDLETGIGSWSDDDFIKALRKGLDPNGSPYYPSFPFTSYTGMSIRDIMDIKAWIFAQKPVYRKNQEHNLKAPYSWRSLMGIWRIMFFEAGKVPGVTDKKEKESRGSYLVNVLGHCGECHTPRNMLGDKKRTRLLAGTRYGPGGVLVPNITSDYETGIGNWTESELRFFLISGVKPNGDTVVGEMQEVIEESLKHLSEKDIQEIARYLLKSKPIHNSIGLSKKGIYQDNQSDWWD